jgi:hypothetical protein
MKDIFGMESKVLKFKKANYFLDMSKFSKSSVALPPSVRENSPPPIPFISKVKKLDKVDGPDTDKSEWIKLEFLMDPDNAA